MFIKDLLFPRLCLGCGRLGSYICLNCQKKLVFIKKDTCLYCGKESYLGLTHPSCKKRYGLDGFMAVFYYSNILKKIIKNIKYRLVKEAFYELFQVINNDIFIDKVIKINKLGRNFLINPIPLHSRKLKTRGFNQAEIIAHFFCRLMNLPLGNALIRIKYTQAQAMTKGKERYLNIKNAFDINKDCQGKSVILVDDLITTGATVKDAGLTLKRNNADWVYSIAIAKG